MVDFLVNAAAALTCVAFMLALYRFLKGPSVADRVVAFDVVFSEPDRTSPEQLAERLDLPALAGLPGPARRQLPQ